MKNYDYKYLLQAFCFYGLSVKYEHVWVGAQILDVFVICSPLYDGLWKAERLFWMVNPLTKQVKFLWQMCWHCWVRTMVKEGT